MIQAPLNVYHIDMKYIRNLHNIDNSYTNSIEVTTFENCILRIGCNKAEEGLKTTSCSQNSLNTLAIDEPLEYARLALDGEMQAWVDSIDNLEVC